MAITEENRHQLYRRLEEVLGHEEATVMMEHLPPVGWADVATKRDLDQHAAIMKRDLEVLGAMTKHDLDQHAAMTKHDLEVLAAMTKRDLEALAAMTKRDLDAIKQSITMRFEAVDHRFDVMDARFEARLERSLREQTNRYFVGMGAILTVLLTIQQVVDRLLA